MKYKKYKKQNDYIFISYKLLLREIIICRFAKDPDYETALMLNNDASFTQICIENSFPHFHKYQVFIEKWYKIYYNRYKSILLDDIPSTLPKEMNADLIYDKYYAQRYILNNRNDLSAEIRSTINCP